MAEERLQPELERRLRLLEDRRNQGDDYDGAAWAALIGFGVLLPILALVIGRMV